MNHIIEMPLPPSVNKRLIRMRGTNRFILSTDARQYIENESLKVMAYCRKNNIEPFKNFFYLDMKFWLKDKRMDSHNLKKILFDCLERGGLVENDKWIMDRTQLVDYDKESPKIVLQFETR